MKTSIVSLLPPPTPTLCFKPSLQAIRQHSCIWKLLLWDRQGNSAQRDSCVLGTKPLPPITSLDVDLFTPQGCACAVPPLYPAFLCDLQPGSPGLLLCFLPFAVSAILSGSPASSCFLIALAMSSLLSFLSALDTSRGHRIFSLFYPQ